MACLYLVLVLAVISATFTAICEGHLHAIFAILSMYVLWTHTATFERGRFWRRRRSPCGKRGGREEEETLHSLECCLLCLKKEFQIQGSNLSEKFINIHVSKLCPFCNRDSKITRKQAIPPHVADQLGGLN